MTKNTTTARRRAGAAAVAAALLVLPGCATWSELTGEAAPAASGTATPSVEPSSAAPTETPTATPSPTPDPTTPEPTPSPEPSQEPEPEESAEPESEPDDETSSEADEGEGAKDEKDTEDAEPQPEYLEVGSTGDEVAALQQQLQDLGYYLPDVDGSFGPMTQQAVWALQKAAGLYRDGVVGPKTEKAIADGVRASAESSSGKVVEIDLDRQLIKAVEDGTVVRTINASSGNGETYEAKGRTYTATTPRGTFAVYMERDYLHESTLELGSMYRPKYFTGGIAVHGSGSIPPYPASHGCIRVSNSAMNWLWDTWGMPKGTTVIVY